MEGKEEKSNLYIWEWRVNVYNLDINIYIRMYCSYYRLNWG